MNPQTHPLRAGLPQRIEAFLFSEGGSLTLKRLAKLLNESEEHLTPALRELESSLQGRGISLVCSGTEVSLVLSAAMSEEIRTAHLHEMGKEIGDAGLEVLAIVLYHGPSTRSQIDYIRGVNTSSTIRSLLSRGLLERAGNPSDAREYVYRPTVELLAHLGVTRVDELPDYGTISNELKSFEETGPFEQHASTSDDTFNADGSSEGLAAQPQ